jgi:signal transduction histidine kinase
VIHLDLPAEAPSVYADRRRLFQALGNIVSNAQKFSPDGAAIEVTVRQDDGNVIWEVRDHGPGISIDDQRHLFERFFRGRSDIESGSGLGQPIALATVQAHGGTIEVESDLGSGSTFRVTVPRGDGAAGSEQA